MLAYQAHMTVMASARPDCFKHRCHNVNRATNSTPAWLQKGGMTQDAAHSASSVSISQRLDEGVHGKTTNAS